MYVLAHATKACSSGDSRRLILFPPPHSSPSGPRIVLILSFGGNEAVGSARWNPALVPREGACRSALPPLHQLILNGALRGTLIQPRISYPTSYQMALGLIRYNKMDVIFYLTGSFTSRISLIAKSYDIFIRNHASIPYLKSLLYKCHPRVIKSYLVPMPITGTKCSI